MTARFAYHCSAFTHCIYTTYVDDISSCSDWSCSMCTIERELLSLPTRLGGLGIIDLSKTAASEFATSTKLSHSKN